MLSQCYPPLAATEPYFKEIVFLSTGATPDAKPSEIGIPAYDYTISGRDAFNRLLSDLSAQGNAPSVGTKYTSDSNQLATTYATKIEGNGGVLWRVISYKSLINSSNINYGVVGINWNLKLIT